MNDRFSDLMIEKYILDELEADKKRLIDAAVKNDALLRKRINTIKKDNIQILKRYPHEVTAKRILDRLEKAGKTKVDLSFFRRRAFAAAASMLTAAAIAAVVFYPAYNNEHISLAEKMGYRLKGGENALYIYKKKAGGAEELRDGYGVRAGDLLQIAYRAKDDYGMIFSIDGRRSVTLHYPCDEKAPSNLNTKSRISLPVSYELDDAPNYEKFIFLTSKKRIDVSDIIFRVKKALAGGDARLVERIDPNKSYNIITLNLLKKKDKNLMKQKRVYQ
jgi:hypothetical protein